MVSDRVTYLIALAALAVVVVALRKAYAVEWGLKPWAGSSGARET